MEQKKQKQLSLNLSVIKDLSPELAARHENDDNGFWTYATREVVDSMGDVIRVDGIDFGLYHNPPETHLKVLAGHLRILPNGEAPVVGLVTDYVKTLVPYKGKLVKALACYIEWMRDGKTNELQPLAAHYKGLKDAKPAPGIDSVSVGIMIDDYTVMENGGLDVTKSSIFELSLVTVPANAGATFVKAIQDLGYEFEKAEEPAEPESSESSEESEENDEGLYRLRSIVEEAVKSALADSNANLQASVSDLNSKLSGIVERLDLLESAIVVLTQSAAQEKDDRDEEPTKGLDELDARLSGLLKFMSR